jgi:flagellin-specific chaperone FliS
MIFDQLERDLADAQAAFPVRDIETIHIRLLHAQEIVLVLRDSLAGSDWTGAEPLRSVYLFLYNRLVECNVKKDATLIPMCQEIVAKINDANRRAVAAEAATAGGRVA